MKNKLLSFTAIGFLLFAFVLASAPAVRAEGVDDKIQALEDELSQLKAEQEQMKGGAVGFEEGRVSGSGGFADV